MCVCVGVGGVAYDKFVTLVVKMVYGKMSVLSRQVLHVTIRPNAINADFLQTSCNTTFVKIQ